MTTGDETGPELLSATLVKAHADHQAGRLGGAEQAYRRVLDMQPDHPDALHLLGVIALQTGHNDTALRLLRQAIAVSPDVASFHNNLGNALKAAGDVDGAAAAYGQALDLDPDNSEAHCNRGVLQYENGKIDDAIGSYGKALEANPLAVEALINLGVAHGARGDQQHAVALYRNAIDVAPEHPEVWNNLGTALHKLGKFDDAVTALRRAAELRPSHLDPYLGLGNAYRQLGLTGKAAAAFQQVIRLKPDHADAHNSLGIIQKARGELELAAGSFRSAIGAAPDLAEAHANLGNTLKDGGQITEAVAAYRQATKLKPHHGEINSGFLLCLNYQETPSTADIHAEHRQWAKRQAEVSARINRNHANSRDPLRPLRIGYVSPDFRTHSVAFFIQALLAAHDGTEVRVVCYADLPRPDDMTARLRARGHEWRFIFDHGDDQVGSTIRDDKIDVLVDLAGHTARNRLGLFAREPAPVQVSYLGYCNTTGLDEIAYRLTDGIADSDESDAFYSERLCRLPRCFLCYSPVSGSPDVAPLPALTAGHITFG